jgi:quinol monooxygenase YgiN
MSQIAVIARITCQPGKRADVEAGLKPMLDHTESEPGTQRYVLLRDSADEDVLWMYEVYQDQASLESHQGSDAMKALGAAIGSHLAGRPELHFTAPVGGKGL